MTRVYIIIFFLLCSYYAKTQSIYWALNINKNNEYKSGKPKKITDSTTYNITTSAQLSTGIKLFDENGMLTYSEYNHITGGYGTLTKYIYDTASRLLVRQDIEYRGYPAVTRSSMHFEYDEKWHLKRVVHKDSAEKLLQITNLVNNEKGHPVQLIEVNSNGIQSRKETAVYDYAKNRVHVTAYAADGNLAFANSLAISHKDASKFPDDKGEFKYNEHGDVIAYPGKLSDGVNANFEIDRTYDKTGNWLENKLYEIINPNGKKERVLVTVSKREYFY